MRKVLLIKSHRTRDPNREGGELSTYEKLRAALEERVEKATNERDRSRARRELKEFAALKPE
jgi:hypothetical protein